MNRARLRVGFTILGVVIGAIVAVVVGRWVGSSIADSRSEDQKLQLEAYLARNIQGIEIGRPFPDLTVWTPEGNGSSSIPELLKDGGVVFCVSSVCSSCVEAITSLLQARDRVGSKASPLTIVTSPGAATLVEALADRGIQTQIWCDQQDRLRLEYKVLTTRAWFLLDSSGVVRGLGSAGFDPDEYAQILQADGSRPAVGVNTSSNQGG